MTAIQLRAELTREVDQFADDENILAQILEFVKSLTTKKPDPTAMTKEQFFAKLDHSRRQAQCGEVYSKREDETFDQFFTRLENEV